MALVKFVADQSNHRKILNGSSMNAYIKGLSEAVRVAYTAGTVKKTTSNATMVETSFSNNATHLKDRAQAVITTFGPYNLQRELGGLRNHRPERSLWKALHVTGGDLNEGATPKFVGAPGPSVRSFKRKGARR